MKRFFIASLAMLCLCVSVVNADQITFTVGTDFNGEFWDGPGSPFNETGNFFIAPDAVVTGLGWDVVTTSFGASWGSEQVFGFGNDFVEINLTASATAAPVAGEANSSGGILNFADFAIPDIVLDADGLLFFELSETFDDAPGQIDGVWEAGSTITFEFTSDAIPEPTAATALMLSGLAVLVRRKR